jgi:hypothetical protein
MRRIRQKQDIHSIDRTCIRLCQIVRDKAYEKTTKTQSAGGPGRDKVASIPIEQWIADDATTFLASDVRAPADRACSNVSALDGNGRWPSPMPGDKMDGVAVTHFQERIGVAMNLSISFLDDFREIQEKLSDLERVAAATRIELTNQIRELRHERDRLTQQNLQLESDVKKWRTRHDDLARE